MKRTVYLLPILCCIPSLVQSQSTMEFPTDTWIEVQTGADICAEQIIYNGNLSGGGTKCGEGARSLLAFSSPDINSFSAAVLNNSVELKWSLETELNNCSFEIERASSSTMSDPNNPKSESAEGGRNPGWELIGYIAGSVNPVTLKEYKFVDTELPPGKYSYRLKQIDYEGSFIYSEILEAAVSLPEEFSLFQNYPNPFNPATVIKFQMPLKGHVSLIVYDIIGKEVITLVNENKEAGYHEINFNGSGLASGTYIYRLNVKSTAENSAGYISTKKMILLK